MGEHCDICNKALHSDPSLVWFRAGTVSVCKECRGSMTEKKWIALIETTFEDATKMAFQEIACICDQKVEEINNGE